MTFVSVSKVYVYSLWVDAFLAKCLISERNVVNVKLLLGVFNQEKGLVRAFSMIVKSSRTFA